MDDPALLLGALNQVRPHELVEVICEFFVPYPLDRLDQADAERLDYEGAQDRETKGFGEGVSDKARRVKGFALAACSPLTSITDQVRSAVTGASHFPVEIDLTSLALFTTADTAITSVPHRRTTRKRMNRRSKANTGRLVHSQPGRTGRRRRDARAHPYPPAGQVLLA